MDDNESKYSARDTMDNAMNTDEDTDTAVGNSSPAQLNKTDTRERRHQCGVCGKRFSKSWRMKRHYRTHTVQKPFNCHQCSKVFPDMYHLKRHEKTHFGTRINREKPYQCSCCRKQFERLSHIKMHYRVHNGEKPFRCRVCRKSFPLLGNLKVHKIIHTVCNKPSKPSPASQQSIKRQNGIRTGERLYQCTVCSKICSNLSSLTKHSRTQHSCCDTGICNTFTNTSAGQYNWRKQYVRIHFDVKSYLCAVCSKRFSYAGSLKRHSKIHAGQKPYQCDVGGSMSAGQDNFRKHNRIDSGEKPYKCTVCSKTFASKGSFKRHSKIHAGQKPYQCNIGSNTSAGQDNFRKHNRIDYGEKPYRCTVCHKRFSDSSSMNKHSRTHSGQWSENARKLRYIRARKKPYRCTVCSKRFPDSSSISRHSRAHIGEKSLNCHWCWKAFSDMSCLKLHEKIHFRTHISREKLHRYQCSYCRKRFECLSHIKMHYRTHNGEKPFRCRVCRKSFPLLGNLKVHKIIHTICNKPTAASQQSIKGHNAIRTGERLYQCTVCSKIFSNLRTLNNHRRTQSGCCNVGSNTSASRCSLRRHYRIYVDVRPHQCTVCSKRFRNLSDMKGHSKIHTGQKPYQCNVGSNISADPENSSEKSLKCHWCWKAFSDMFMLKRHEKTHFRTHINREKPYQCSCCPKQFEHLSHIKMHYRVHTGEKPFRCHVCRKSFSLPGDLQVHKRIHTIYGKPIGSQQSIRTGTRPYQCTVCSKIFPNLSDMNRHSESYTGSCNVGRNTSASQYKLRNHYRIYVDVRPHQCTVCSKRFTSAWTLNKHRKIHTAQKPHQYNVGSNTSTGQYKLRKHNRIDSGEKPHQCTVCSKTFTSKGSMNRHSRMHTGQNQYQCSVGSDTFTSHYNLREHNRMQTAVCGNKFSDSNSMNRNSITRTGQKPYQYNVGSNRIASQYNLRKHNKIQVGVKRQPCTVCSKRSGCLGTMKTLKRHSSTHTGQKPYHGNVGKDKPARQYKLWKHNRTHVGGIGKQYQCTVCRKRFAYLSSMKMHIKTHPGPKPYQRNIGSITFASQSQLRRHSESHTDERPRKRHVCGSNYSQSSRLRSHLGFQSHRNSHPVTNNGAAFTAGPDLSMTTENPSCEVPSYGNEFNTGFASLVQLNKHDYFLSADDRSHDTDIQMSVNSDTLFLSEISHGEFSGGPNSTTEFYSEEDVKPYICSECPQCFSRADDPNSHMLEHHTGRVFGCGICERRFTSKDALVQHLQTCSDSASTSSNMNRHKKTCTSEKSYQCTICSKTFASLHGMKIHSRTHKTENRCDRNFLKLPHHQEHFGVHCRRKSGSVTIERMGVATRIHLPMFRSCEMPCNCSVCNSSFTPQMQLNQHDCSIPADDMSGETDPQQSENKDNLFISQINQLELSAGSSLNMVSSEHDDLKCICSECLKCFCRVDELNRHMLEHSNGRRFGCGICERRFTCKDALLQHLKTCLL